ncbi:stage III sporulation protein AG [Sediminibacillus halophilus]|uniref:Stage III sporulation protein AG n=1 Tax=Sediminibacillus halophilus TaxID=482461 RepID=A0A1G9LKW0_9BACI|nr:stage III sporulation protein AG [Sediminibacillus halophilus]SDL62612.1 stage III sporulation protein AG [Sediminibacillus halophilus]
MNNPLKKLLSHVKLKQGDDNKPTKLAYVLIVGLVGLLLILVSGIFSSEKNSGDNMLSVTPDSSTNEQETFLNKKEETIAEKDEEIADLEGNYEKELTALLEKIQGVSDVEAMVNLDSTKQKVYEKNLIIGTQTTDETDQNGGERTLEDSTREQEVVLVRQGDKEVPLLVHTKKPDVRGVLVVAKGVDHMQVKQWVVEAVSRVLDVPTHRISVMPKN